MKLVFSVDFYINSITSILPRAFTMLTNHHQETRDIPLLISDGHQNRVFPLQSRWAQTQCSRCRFLTHSVGLSQAHYRQKSPASARTPDISKRLLKQEKSK